MPDFALFVLYCCGFVGALKAATDKGWPWWPTLLVSALWPILLPTFALDAAFAVFMRDYSEVKRDD